MSKKINFDLELELEIRDRNGKIIHKETRKAESFVQNFLNFLAGCLAKQDRSPWDVNNVAQLISPYISPASGVDVEMEIMNVLAGDGEDAYGIVVGSGTTSPGATDYNLESKITHGVSSGQLQYGAVELEAFGLTDNTTYLQFKRVFTNGSGADVTVNEIGLIAKWYRKVGTDEQGPYYFLLIRDVLASSVIVPDGASLTVRYKLQTTT